MIKKLLHTRMRVNDMEETLRFYVDILGLTVENRKRSPRGSERLFHIIDAHPRVEQFFNHAYNTNTLN